MNRRHPPSSPAPSRVLWDRVRSCSVRCRDNESSSSWKNWLALVASWFRAVLYEVQPVRYSTLRHYWRLYFQRQELQQSGRKAYQFLTITVPRFIWALLQTSWFVVRHYWKGLLLAFGYYWFVRWMHEALHAGPVVLIATALVGIFTIGLGDDEDQQGLSAYSVFNRGYQRLLGSLDADALLQQHVGGGIGGGMMNMMPPPPPPPERQGAPEGRAAVGRDENPDLNENGDDSADDSEEVEQDAPAAGAAARLTGKKARRRQKQQQRELRQQQQEEIRRQEEAAMEFGFHNDHDQFDRLDDL